MRRNIVTKRSITALTLVSLAAAMPTRPAAAQEQRALEGINADRIRAHVEYLADDLLEGRGTGTRGYQLAALYVAAQFRAFGLEPGGVDGSYFQPIRFRHSSVDPTGTSLALVRDGREQTLSLDDEFIAAADLLRPSSEVRAPLVFVGFGVTAPEFDYDDYQGIDAAGKIVVMLRGAPASFPGDARAHLSAGDVKSRTAVEHGAVGIVTVWTPADEARFPWVALTRFSRRGSMRWLDAEGAAHGAHPELSGAVILNTAPAAKLFEGASRSLDEVIADAAAGRRPGSFELPGQLQLRTRSEWAEATSPNIIGLLPGSDPVLRDEYVVYTAHVDHEGKGEPVRGDSIYNGAFDNAAGTAALIEIARAFSALPQAPRRSLLFIGTAAEEEGLLGADYYAANPTVPIESIVANVNMDGNLMIFPAADIIPFGVEHSSIEEQVEKAAADVGLAVSPDPMPEQYFFIRSDQYPFIKQGVPAVFFANGFTSADPAVDGLAAVQRWLGTLYHTPFDDLHQQIDWETGAKYSRVSFLTGLYVANADGRPRWRAGDYFGEKFGRRATP